MNLKEVRYKKSAVVFLAVAYDMIFWYLSITFGNHYRMSEFETLVYYSFLIWPSGFVAMALSDSVPERILLIVIWLITMYISFWAFAAALLIYGLSA